MKTIAVFALGQALVNPLLADEEGNVSCRSITSAAWQSCFEKNTTYAHGALKFFNNTLCMLNKGFTSEAEVTLCHFTKSMGMAPDKAALPQTITKTFGTRTVVLTVEKPTEAFATTLGYDIKGTVTINGAKFMILYWGGTGEDSKGFMIQGANGFATGEKHPSYIQWDRTDKTNQFVKVFVASFTTTYLGTVGQPSASNYKAGDRAMFGTATYNATTKAVSTQIVLIEGQRGGGTSTTPACFKMFASGTKEGTITVAKTDNSHGTTGHAVTSTTTDSTDMDAAQLTDSLDTPNLTGNLNPGQFGGLTIAFLKSCNDVNGAGATGKPFADSEVNFAAAPADIF